MNKRKRVFDDITGYCFQETHNGACVAAKYDKSKPDAPDTVLKLACRAIMGFGIDELRIDDCMYSKTRYKANNGYINV